MQEARRGGADDDVASRRHGALPLAELLFVARDEGEDPVAGHRVGQPDAGLRTTFPVEREPGHEGGEGGEVPPELGSTRRRRRQGVA
jgi:hypothetical protein